MGIGAIIGGIATVAAGAIGASANSHAADVAGQSAAANNELSREQYNTTKGLVQPYVDKGNVASDTLQGFLGLGGDPVKTQAAFDHFLNSTGYQFNRQQGLDAVDQSKASEGLFNSGAALKALQDRGTALADTYGQQYIGNLNDVASRGVSAIGTLTGAGNTNVTNQTANNNASALANENAITANSKLFGSVIDKLGGVAGAAIGGSSFGGGGSGGGFNSTPNLANVYGAGGA